MSSVIRACVNGEQVEFLCKHPQTALDVLRDTLGLTGTKNGCGTGDCGACTILLSGRPVCACLVMAMELDGAEVTTVEGVATNGRVHPVQRALLDIGGFQCGICTPGVVVAAVALLETSIV
jgi:aerobic carbon-monoxide dehydrogenase small subunit